MYELLLKKKQETEEKIRYEQQLLKNSPAYRDVSKWNPIRTSAVSKPFRSVILFESEKQVIFSHSRCPSDTGSVCLLLLFKTYHIDNCDIQPRKTIVALEQDIMEELHMDYPPA